MTKVVTFGAFVEILPGVEGLVHISELAQHHVENPREVVSQGDEVKAKIIEVDGERRRLSLSLKRVEGGGVVARADDSEPIEGTPDLDLSEEVFPETQAVAEAVPADEEPLPERGCGRSRRDAGGGPPRPRRLTRAIWRPSSSTTASRRTPSPRTSRARRLRGEAPRRPRNRTGVTGRGARLRRRPGGCPSLARASV